MSIFLPATSPIDSPENYEIIVPSRSIPSYSIMSIFPPAMSEIGSPDNYEIIFRNPSIPSYYPFFPPDMSDTDSYGSSTPNHQLSIPSLYLPPNDSETDNSSSLVNGISLDERVVILEIKKLSVREVQKIKWNLLDKKMEKWIQAVKILVRLILSGEKSLSDQIFSGADETKEIRFNETVKGCVMQLLDFGKAVASGRRLPENLFRILEMYDVMAKALAQMEGLITDDVVISEAREVLTELGEAASWKFLELENAMQNESSVKGMQSGGIHPLTQYVMNYVQLMLDYSDTMNLLEIGEDDDSDDHLKLTPVARRVLVLITSLLSNLEEKSKLYKDRALQYIFLMNNVLYIVEEVKGSDDLMSLFGDDWFCERFGQTRQYATSYLRASWTKVLHCLKDEGIGGSSNNASRVALKERFMNFNACFVEIYRVQTAWKVPDAQLREELRISISERVILAYRSFMGRFRNQVESGRHAGKYIKYTAEDLEGYLLDLFEGSPRVLQKKYMG
ncbi:exocyst complex component EXO70A1-like [Castanea sativa]|uniref:exocyst complex component EXO70A1-like n=1 Tax=Castanea sativa TaxID=21020 RepID=UPI003F6548EC